MTKLSFSKIKTNWISIGKYLWISLISLKAYRTSSRIYLDFVRELRPIFQASPNDYFLIHKIINPNK